MKPNVPIFYVGLHHPSTAWPFLKSMISINSIRSRRGQFRVNDWIMDSGAFTEISTHGRWRTEPERYAEEINRWKANGNLVAAVSQDYMCEKFILEKTGLNVGTHQDLTIERYVKIKANTDACILPVLQGYTPSEYQTHLKKYGNLLTQGQWVGVGSVCKRNGDPGAIEQVLEAINSVRPDLRLHGFGLKCEALKSNLVRAILHSCDSLSWSFAARKEGRDANDPREALRYCAKVDSILTTQTFFTPNLFPIWNF